jgi:hypothetical protein
MHFQNAIAKGSRLGRSHAFSDVICYEFRLPGLRRARNRIWRASCMVQHHVSHMSTGVHTYGHLHATFSCEDATILDNA